MTPTGFKFDAQQSFQIDAIQSVVDLFDGQPADGEALLARIRLENSAQDIGDQHALEMDLSQEIGTVGNRLIVGKETILANLQRIQDRNGLEVQTSLYAGGLDFDIEMETGTGKTYVYLRTAFELARHYNFTKFIILVPSVAIREGVATSIQLMRSHFRDLYPDLPFDATVYRGEAAEEVQSFATSTNVQILVMTINSIRGDKNNRIIHQNRDKLNGLRPIDFLKATQPIVIMDEPQNMESELSGSSIEELTPAFRLRYSATHKKQRNVVYRLDPVDAHDLGLVKQIVVADLKQKGSDATPYIKLVEVKSSPFVARLELACRIADGTLERKVVSVRSHQELSDEKITDNPIYEGWRVTEMSIEPASVDLTNYGILNQGESIGGASKFVYKEMIRETIREHLRKDSLLRRLGIKVLSLFFVDKVASYLGDGTDNDNADGDFVKWFDEVYLAERNSAERYKELLPYEPSEVRRAYFSQIKRGGKTTFQDSTGITKADDEAYELIMRDKARLLDENEPVRFIFSHSALREGWDNPNVFQICALREMGAEVERRQTIGRGLRLPVTKTDEGYMRVGDRSIATLTVIATEDYKAFAKALQKEYKRAGVEIGQVRPSEFARIAKLDDNGAVSDEVLGYAESVAIWEHLVQHGFIKDGLKTDKFQPDQLDFELNLPGKYHPYEAEIISRIERSSIERYVKSGASEKPVKLNKGVYLSEEFAKFWETIAKKTTYRVTVNRERIIENAVQAIQEAPRVDPLRIVTTYTGLRVVRGGALGKEVRESQKDLKGTYELPDIVSELQKATSLTRATIIDILTQSGRLKEFIENPNDFIAMAKKRLQDELAKLVVNGIQYEQIPGYVYELRELQADGKDEQVRFIEHLYKVQNEDKTDYDYVLFDGGPNSPERQFAEHLDNNPDVRFFMKLPRKFQIETPVGPYNPDWAIIKKVGGEDRIYLVRETKSTFDDMKLRPTELAKIKSAKKHFAAIGLGKAGLLEGYDRSVPGKWNI
ncbi:MAG: DEAD/DEAH box helicase family protein [Fimbriimonadaceae bacterium]|nr:DEAD/DEAH box helicase family protein [Fimbriimonadaceae bacterium]